MHLAVFFFFTFFLSTFCVRGAVMRLAVIGAPVMTDVSFQLGEVSTHIMLQALGCLCAEQPNGGGPNTVEATLQLSPDEMSLGVIKDNLTKKGLTLDEQKSKFPVLLLTHVSCFHLMTAMRIFMTEQPKCTGPNNVSFELALDEPTLKEFMRLLEASKTKEEPVEHDTKISLDELENPENPKTLKKALFEPLENPEALKKALLPPLENPEALKKALLEPLENPVALKKALENPEAF